MVCSIKDYFSDNEKREKFRKSYLFSYNLIQSLGWSYILLLVLNYNINRPQKVLYDVVKIPLMIFQIGAFLEYYHALYRLTKSSPGVTFQQIYSRIMVLCAVLMAVENSQKSVGFALIMIAWPVTEIIRYFTYTFAIYGRAPYFLTWLRYTTFIPLYPIGVTGELLCMYAAVVDLLITKQWSMELPNKWNVEYHYYYYIIFNMVLYIPFFPKLYLHMFNQRKKVLGAKKVE